MKTKPMYKSKTFWTCLGGLVGAAGAYATGQMDLSQAIQIGLTSLVGLFLRDGMRDKPEKAES